MSSFRVRGPNSTGRFASAISPDCATLAICERNGIEFWDLRSGKRLHAPEQAMGPLSFSADAAHVITSTPRLRVWQTMTGKPVFTVPESIRYDSDRDEVWSQADHLFLRREFWRRDFDGDQTVTKRVVDLWVWDLKTGQEIQMPTDRLRRHVEASYDGSHRVLSDNRTRKVLEKTEGLRTISARYAAGNRFLACFQYGVATHRDPYYGPIVVSVWENESAALRKRWEIETEREFLFSSIEAALSPCGRFLAHTCCFHKRRMNEDLRANAENVRVTLWRTDFGKKLHVLKGLDKNVTALAISEDGRLLACGGEDASVRVWDSLLGKEVARLTGHLGPVETLVFSPQGRMLASASYDGTTLIWDLRKATFAKEGADAWNALGGDDAALAMAAEWRLVAEPTRTLPMLQRQLQPVPLDLDAKIAQLARELSSNNFTTRTKATKALLELGDLAEPHLRLKRTEALSPENIRRIDAILAQMTIPSARRLRTLRGISVLERIGGHDAQAQLQRLADGLAEARETLDARAALTRLAPR